MCVCVLCAWSSFEIRNASVGVKKSHAHAHTKSTTSLCKVIQRCKIIDDRLSTDVECRRETGNTMQRYLRGGCSINQSDGP